MTETLTPQTAAAPAFAAARNAAERAEVSVHLLTKLDEMVAAGDLVREIWGGDYLPVNLQRAVAHAGSYVSGAVRNGRVVGILLGFLGLREGALFLHSHVAGVLPGAQGRSVGFALKQHQRAWALERGVPQVTWTFDPLVSRNAYFNLTKLAAVGTGYETNFYGEMGDGINGGEESDRLVVEWRLDESAVVAAAEGHPTPADVTALRRDGAVPLLTVGDDSEPVTNEARDDVLLCQIPEDILALRAAEPSLGLARRWRSAVRQQLGGAIADGYEARGMSRDGWYVLTRREGHRS